MDGAHRAAAAAYEHAPRSTDGSTRLRRLAATISAVAAIPSMYVFTIAALLGLGILALAMIVERYVMSSERRDWWMALLVVLGIGAAWITDFSIWAFGV